MKLICVKKEIPNANKTLYQIKILKMSTKIKNCWATVVSLSNNFWCYHGSFKSYLIWDWVKTELKLSMSGRYGLLPPSTLILKWPNGQNVSLTNFKKRHLWPLLIYFHFSTQKCALMNPGHLVSETIALSMDQHVL